MAYKEPRWWEFPLLFSLVLPLVCGGVMTLTHLADKEQAKQALSAQERTEAKAADILSKALSAASEGVEVGVVLGCYTKWCGSSVPAKARVLTPRGEERWQIIHGREGKTYPVDSGFKLVRCYCSEDECVLKSPQGEVYLTPKRVMGYTVFYLTK